MAVQPVDMEKCVRCGMCVMYCPVDVFRFDKEKKEPVIAYPDDCMVCGMCEDRCKAKAITVTPDRVAQVMISWR